MDYQAAIDYLGQHTNFEARPADIYSPERFGLDRARRLLDEVGDPQYEYPVVHVAGSKGKGSVVAMLDSILRAAGLRVGMYTSPHLSDFRERMQVNRMLVDPDDFAAVISDLRPHVDAVEGITYFEIATAAAFEWLARQAVDIAVVEVGLGGRLDPTNLVAPSVCAVTAISLEHTELLGDTLAAIAAEKGGIIKAGVPVVSAPQATAARDVLRDIAAERGAPFVLVGQDWLFERRWFADNEQVFAVWPADQPGALREYSLSLCGAHQVENAAVAVAVVHELQREGWELTHDDIAAGLRCVDWPARFEVQPGSPTVVFDAAHNQESAARLAAALLEYFPGQRPVLVFGAMRDKNVTGMFTELLPLASCAIMTGSAHPRAADPRALAEQAAAYACPVSTCATVREALAQAVDLAGPAGLVLVAGSVIMAGEARRNARVLA